MDSEYYAKIVIDKLITASEKLHDFPKIGRIVPEFSNEYIRELFVYSYRLMYEIIENDIMTLLQKGQGAYPPRGNHPPRSLASSVPRGPTAVHEKTQGNCTKIVIK
jgi:plasmid stabilization system protein ParE